ncbi:MAG: hypothetical protein H6765_07095 [Candidatus Peribacteria bacterium]|nr:MAG: hypothetical protein H6765_07095 [Candidatus Peribacteria bacterium]
MVMAEIEEMEVTEMATVMGTDETAMVEMVIEMETIHMLRWVSVNNVLVRL